MDELTIEERITRALETGNWIVRADDDGVSPSQDAKGFRWAPIGEWTEAPDFSPHFECGGGLHGQDKDHGGMIFGKRLVFCETDGKHVPLGNKVKVRRASILLVNALPEGFKQTAELDLSGTRLSALPEGFKQTDWLNLSGTPISALPEGFRQTAGLDLSGTPGDGLGLRRLHCVLTGCRILGFFRGRRQ